jgi:hypothetical protein
MKSFVKVLLLFIITFNSGCAVLTKSTSSSAIVTIKTKQIRLNDTAFINRSFGSTEIEIYKAGVLALVIQSGRQICLDGECFDEDIFVKRFFHETYPVDFIHTLFAYEPLNLEGATNEKKPDGFTQQIFKKNRYNITYRVEKKRLFFRDRTNKILIQIKETP